MAHTPGNSLVRNVGSVKTLLKRHEILIVGHQPLSPDLAPCDFFLFPIVKKALKGTKFETVDAVKAKTTEEMKGLSENDLKLCFERWKIRMKVV
ncbi:hypothetical protein AVEN_7333-1 [Araneus ventricosus]|uniref:Uncharacterized protein n=1 Tax=Araneus ventricosus TaxID=182803 RepID=A0A4Y2BRS8_ARAVE|nr:hypothetical protein AVEN_7333-1 [Araneus ventricosus]